MTRFIFSMSALAALMASSAAAAPEGLQPISDRPAVLVEQGTDPAFGAIFLSKSRMVMANGRVLDLEFVSEDIEEQASDAMGDTASFQRFTLKDSAVLGKDERLCGGKAQLMTASIRDADPERIWIEFFDILSFDDMARMTQPCASKGFAFNLVAVLDESLAVGAVADRAESEPDGASATAAVDMDALDAAYVAAAATALAIEVPELESDPGKWIRSVNTNPMDDSKTVVLRLMADEGRSSHGDPITLTARCQSNTTELYINWNDYLGDDSHDVYNDYKYVDLRLGSRKASTQKWGVSTDNDATFAPGWAGDLLKEMVRENRLVVSTTPYNENPVTAVFDLQGLEHPLRELAKTCGWSF